MSMSHYGSTGNLSGRGASPSYASLGRHRDDYNRFETKRHHDSLNRSSAERQLIDLSKFSGYGARPGSGVEMTEHRWTGGEIITDPSQMPKGLKPRRMFYSPIGDGVVAADGVEKKRGPVDLSPRVTITTLSKVDRGERGQGGVNVYEKEWSSTLPGEGVAGSVFDGNFPNVPDGGRGKSMEKPPAPLPPAPEPATDRGNRGNAGPTALHTPIRAAEPAPISLAREPYYPPYEEPVRPISVASTNDPYRIVDTKTGYLITNPRELIHQYATTTPIAIMDLNDGTPVQKHTSVKSMYQTLETQETEQRFAPYAPYRVHQNGNSHGGHGGSGVVSPNRFVRNLRDETMTHSQREANTHLDALNQRDPNASQKISEIRQRTMTRGGHDDIDQLTNQLLNGLNTRY
ncbi:unnamed protein product, partial [Mesorhabditis belari]|uniref:Uncharacterized protein n=1 Tax=Mesorhabditis belari TaxID=2138241 RepID=A0AAF3EV41_9BILA